MMDIFDRHANLCSVFSDSKRLRIMWFLENSEHSVSEIANHLGVSLQKASQHLRVMRDKGVVEFRKNGQLVYYRLSNPKFMQASRLIRDGLLEQLDKLHQSTEDRSQPSSS
jgi:ArsR family transcriptional regulator